MFADISEMNRAFGRVSLRRAYSAEVPEAIFAALLLRLTTAATHRVLASLGAAGPQVDRMQLRIPPATPPAHPDESAPALIPSTPRMPTGGSDCACALVEGL